MGIQILGVVGPNVSSDGATPGMRLDRSGAQVIIQGHGRYYEAAVRKNLFTAALNAVGSITNNSSSLLTGLILYNPTGNSKNFALQKVQGMVTASSSSTALGLYSFTQASALTVNTPLTPINNFLRQTSSSSSIVSTSVTLATSSLLPTIIQYLLHNTNAIATTGEDAGFNMDFEGSIVIPPGTGVCYCSTGVTIASALVSMSWEEILI